MSTSISTPTSPRKTSTPSRHRRSTISLHSKPGLGLIRTISRDLVTGWHTHTALQNEASSPPSTDPPPVAYKPRYAARDAMKGFPSEQEDALTKSLSGSERSRQDSVVPMMNEDDLRKPMGFVEEGLVPDHSNDTWTPVWDFAYETRVRAYHGSSTSVSVSPTSDNFSAALPTPTFSPPACSGTTRQPRKNSKISRPPLSSRFLVTDAEIKAFIFDNHERRGRYESPEAFLRPKIKRRESVVPSLVGSEDSGLEDLKEEGEEGEEQEQEKEDVGVEMKSSGGGCVCCSRCGGCTSGRG